MPKCRSMPLPTPRDLLEELYLLGAVALSVACFSLWLVFMRQLAPNIDSLDGQALGPDGGEFRYRPERVDPNVPVREF